MISLRHLRRGAFLATFLLAAAWAQAQDTGNGFLFQAPAGEISFRGGFDRAIAGSDVFAFAVKELTLNRRDFSSMTFATDVYYVLTARLHARFSFGVLLSTTPSAFR